jgi:hypothetical protein
MWTSVIIDVEGIFLQGRFKNKEELHIEVLQVFAEWHPGNVVLRMSMPLYGTKQAMHCFFKTCAKHVKNMTYKQSNVDLCLNFAWQDNTWVILAAWVDDVMILGPHSLVEKV